MVPNSYPSRQRAAQSEKGGKNTEEDAPREKSESGGLRAAQSRYSSLPRR
jgi:hypothetical protein